MAKLYFNFGAMNSGKTADLIRAVYNYTERGQKPIVFTSSIDTRTGIDELSCRIPGFTCNAPVVEVNPNFQPSYIRNCLFSPEKFDAIFIDEAHFFTAPQIDALAGFVYSHNLPVLAYGLKTNFKGELFKGSKRLIELADEIREIKSVCWCGKAARFNGRIVGGKLTKEGPEVLVGGNETYVGLCRQHWNSGEIEGNSN